MTNETKQTAVEWLIEQLKANENIRWRGTNLNELENQAKEMEKEQIIKSFEVGYNQNYSRQYETIEQYYNETYGGNK